MHATQKMQNVIRGLLQRNASANIKRYLWDNEYRRGRWNCLDVMADDCLYPFVESHAKNGSILDVGCGPGTTGNELSAAQYLFYTGVDISDVAINKARKRTEDNQRADKNEYFQAYILRSVPKRQYNVIVLGDSIYYLSKRRIPQMLDRYSKHLKPNGVFIVRIFDVSGKHRRIINMIERDFDIVERQSSCHSQISVIAFRQLASRHVLRTGNHL